MYTKELYLMLSVELFKSGTGQYCYIHDELVYVLY